LFRPYRQGLSRSRYWHWRRITNSKALTSDYVSALIVCLSLRFKEFDGDIAERRVGKVASDVGEAAAGEMRFAVLELKMNFGFVAHRVSDPEPAP